ncbi:MAG TPA: sugar ABC transporter ATP-binding protein [Actinocatenispora sp.]
MDALLSVDGLVKQFPGVRALDGVTLSVRPGEVHCLLGQNGAGKSTLIKVLSGAHTPDAGVVRWRGRPVGFGTPLAALRAGLATIYQELDLVDGLSVAENVFLGHERSRLGFSLRTKGNAEAAALLARLGHPDIAPGRPVGSLPAASRQIVSMARALSYDARLIVMDEPSAVLDAGEVATLFRVVRQLTADGVAVVYISHRLDEIRQIGDRVTVLKDGRTVAAGLPARTTTTAELVRLMTGRTVEYAFGERTGPVEQRELLRVSGLARAGEFTDVSFTVHSGEIVGLAGLVGSGRTEIVETVYGARRPTAGTVTVDGRRLRPGSVRAAVRAGMGLCPEERKSQGLFGHDPVYRNVSVASLARYATAGFVAPARELAAAARSLTDLDVRPADPRRPVRTLSGGNQQKVVLARWLVRGCRLLVLDEPTRGVDVGARTELYRLIRRLAADGVGVLLVSSEIPEVLGLADRVLVVADGRVVADAPAPTLTEERVLDLVMEERT